MVPAGSSSPIAFGLKRRGRLEIIPGMDEKQAFPLSIRAVAWLLIAGAAGSLASFAWGLFRDRFELELAAPLLIWLAVRLLKRSSGARPWAMLFGMVYLLGGIAFAFLALLRPYDQGMYIGDLPISAFPRWLPFVISALAVAEGAFFVAALRRLRRQGWFLPAGSVEPVFDRGTRRGLWASAGAGVLIAIASHFLFALVPPPTDEGIVVNRDGMLDSVEYGTRVGKLAYVVLQRTQGVMEQAVKKHGRGYAAIEVNGLPPIDLPAEDQLHEIVDGRHRSSDERVTLEELHTFMDSRPAAWDIDALVRFAEGRRGAPVGPAR
jgi:hypothetical protein